MEAGDLRPLGLFVGMSDDQLEQLVSVGETVPVVPGVVLFREGEPADSWWVLVEGALKLLRHSGREEVVVGRMDVPGRWAGGFRAWDPQGSYLATGVGAAPGRVLRVPAAGLRELTDVWFPLGSHLIEGVLGTARSIESTARQRDALVTLGTLAAGLAHEINNPAAAASRAVAALDEESGTTLAALRSLAAGDLSARQFTALDVLRCELEAESSVTEPLWLADREEELTSWLARHGVEQGWAIAPRLAAAGVDVPWCERALTVLGPDMLGPGLEWVASTLSMTALLAEVRESTGRVSELVAAVRSYSQVDRASRQPVDVTKGLESTLVMLGQKLREGVVVERDFANGTPLVDAYEGELNQVWTNLVDNAVDAMDGRGTLRLATRVDGDAVVVELGDTGHGMTPQVAARAFEAFYTTKDVGKGTGLGLDIARRIIVERHGGTIDIDSSQGGTTVRVRLPVEQRRDPWGSS